MIPFASWVWTLILAFLMGVTLRMPWLVVFSVSMGIILFVANYWNTRSLVGVTYKRFFRFRRGFPGETLKVTIEAQNNKRLPINWLKVEDRWPYNVGPADRNDLLLTHLPDSGNFLNLFSLRWFQKIRRNYDMVFKQRGLYTIGPAVMESGDPFGMMKSTKELDRPEYITVFPDLLPIDPMNLRAEDPLGDQSARKRLFEDPLQPMGVRAYHPEDDFRRIHWPATARTGELQVKVYTPVSARVMMVCLNVSTTARPWLGAYPKTFEHLLKVAATTVYNAIGQGYSVGLLSNGSVAHSDQPFRVAPGKSKDQLGTLLQTLAGATNYVTASFENYLLHSLSAIPIGSALVIITAMNSSVLNETLLRMKRYRMHTTLISLDTSPPAEIPGIRTVHLPFEE
jgi:uncharacterized protein (DUF58 family)